MNSLQSTVSAFADALLSYAIPLAAVGALSMALIEALKMLVDARTRFLARRWTTRLQQMVASSGADVNVGTALSQLIQLTTGVTTEEARTAADRLVESKGSLSWFHAFNRAPEHAMFARDVKGMIAIVQDAMDVVLASPRQYSALYFAMTAGADPKDSKRWHARDPHLGQAAEAEARDLAHCLARIRQAVHRSLDGFQLYAEDRWSSLNQLWAIGVGAVIMLIALTTNGVAFGSALGLSLFGGILAPVAKDLVTALQRVRSETQGTR